MLVPMKRSLFQICHRPNERTTLEKRRQHKKRAFLADASRRREGRFRHTLEQEEEEEGNAKVRSPLPDCFGLGKGARYVCWARTATGASSSASSGLLQVGGREEHVGFLVGRCSLLFLLFPLL